MSEKVLGVLVEIVPAPPPSKKVLLSGPAFPEGCFRIWEQLPRDVWAKVAKNAFHLSRDDLEDFGWFDRQPGWRFNIHALETLVAEGYTLRIKEWGTVTSAQELRAMFSPENIARVQAALREDEGAAQRKAEKATSEERGWKQWVKENLAGLVATTIFPEKVLDSASSGEVHFNTKWYTTGVTYQRFTVGGVAGWLEYYGSVVVAHVPPAVADRWYRQHWNAHRSPEHALWILNRLLSSWTFEDDYPDWVAQNIGKAKLIDLARSGAPIPIRRGTEWAYACASKCYCVPIAVEVYNPHTKQFERQVGYGNPKPLSPIETWVPLGQEKQATWPSLQEIARLEREHRDGRKRSAGEMWEG